MTEAEWRTCEDSTTMLAFLRGKVTDRKLRLFLVSCARSAWDRLEPPDLREAVEAADQFADGLVSEEHLKEHNLAIYRYGMRGSDPAGLEWIIGSNENGSAYFLALATTFSSQGLANLSQTQGHLRGKYLTGQFQPALLREIFGPLPFRDVPFPPEWRSPNVLGLASTVYEERAYDRLPIVADALMDAGCFDEEILDHCRSPGQHVRGCWALDLVLGKE